MELALIWLLLCVVAAMLANRDRRAYFWWLLFSVFLSPLLGFVFLLVVGPRQPRAARLSAR